METKNPVINVFAKLKPAMRVEWLMKVARHVRDGGNKAVGWLYNVLSCSLQKRAKWVTIVG